MKAGELSTESSRINSWRSRLARSTLPMYLRSFLIGVAVLGGFWLTVTPPAGMRVVQLLAGAVALCGATLSARFPLSGASLAGAITASAWVLGLTVDPFLLASIGVFSAAERRGVRRVPWWLIVAAFLLGLTMFVFGAQPEDEAFGIHLRTTALSMMVLGVAWILGARTRQVRDSAAEHSRSMERLRLARDVHDVLSHSLGTIGVRAGVAGHITSLQEPELRLVLGEIEQQARSSLGELKALLQHERESSDSSSFSLATRLDSVMRRAEEVGIRAVFHCPAAVDAIPTAIRTTLYRITQEATTNTIRHARASSLCVSIEVNSSYVELVVADDGSNERQVIQEGYGLKGIRERVALLSGELRVEISTRGFLLRAILPLV